MTWQKTKNINLKKNVNILWPIDLQLVKLQMLQMCGVNKDFLLVVKLLELAPMKGKRGANENFLNL
jgi:hypothetical protein